MTELIKLHKFSEEIAPRESSTLAQTMGLLFEGFRWAYRDLSSSGPIPIDDHPAHGVSESSWEG